MSVTKSTSAAPTHDHEHERVHGPDCEHDHHAPQVPFQRVVPKLGRNDPCHCGSGKKFKKCHGTVDASTTF